MSSKIRVGVVGLGMMGQTHLDVYAGLENVEVVALADADKERLYGYAQAVGNISGQAQGGHALTQARRYTDGYALIADEAIDLVDVCVGTDLHLSMAEAAVLANKHVFIEKPMARDVVQARQLMALAKTSKKHMMVGMCLRFWPGWQWLKEAIESSVYGPLQALHCQRLSAFPGGDFYRSGARCGGALLDMHIHDTDFIRYCLGRPRAVFSRGYAGVSGATDHVMTQYLYGDAGDPPMVSAEGGWSMAQGYDFSMSYRANFAEATVSYHFDGEDRIHLVRQGRSEIIEVAAGMGYEHELRFMIAAIMSGADMDLAGWQAAVDAMLIVEAEQASVLSGQLETLAW